MNIYLVVEGITESIVYPFWINQLNHGLSRVGHSTEVNANNYYLISGQGYPCIRETIKGAVLDTNDNLKFDRLVIAIDSEDFDADERKKEFEDLVQSLNPRVEVKFISQHFCFETWALGNIKIAPRNPKSDELKEYKRFYDITINDPENLPANVELGLNRSQFAFQYLKKLINDKGKNLSYQKNNPVHVMHEKFFNEVKSRMLETAHIKYFQSFLDAFV